MSNVFRRLVLSALLVALILPSVPVFAAPARAGQPPGGSISGVARNASSEPLPNTVIRLRNVETGQLSGTTITDAAGRFSFTGLNSGTYVVEVLDNDRQVVGTSAAIVLSPGAMIAAGLVIQASALGAAAVAGAGATGGAFLTSTLGIVTLAAIAAGVVGAVIVGRDDASPSR